MYLLRSDEFDNEAGSSLHEPDLPTKGHREDRSAQKYRTTSQFALESRVQVGDAETEMVESAATPQPSRDRGSIGRDRRDQLHRKYAVGLQQRHGHP